MKVLVCGGRNFDERGFVNRMLGGIHSQTPFSLVIQGGARGADHLAKLWAESNGVPCCEFPAQWNRFGKKAGHLRNGSMLTFGQPDLVVAFPGGSGTLNMIRQAEEAGVAVDRICPGHVASADPKVCARCGVHINELRPDTEEAA